MNKHIKFLTALAILVFLFITSCGRKAIHGQWRIISNNGSTKFSPADYIAFDEVRHEFLIYEQSKEKEQQGLYYLDNDMNPWRLTLSDSRGNNPVDGICKIEGNKMTIKMPSNPKVTISGNFDVEPNAEVWSLERKEK